ncbi:LysR substrate-binding domain-containing protein [Martelella sp. HB161492]|uniref:LysR substrate-binding domain-containing protein n=1 Tax=Martelella sp. HB161492 TaxID=2720726 RepID=UPI00158FE4C4|nr:LysR substrate-binding domain-containing protein [Martelella sp. HB161492]
MTAPLDLDLVKTFVAVVESGNLSSAALRIGRSQSAVSMQMQRLEQHVGKTLLIRQARTVVPNSTGSEFLIYARRLLKLSDEAQASVIKPQETGRVRIGVPDCLISLLPPILEEFAADHPLISIELVCDPSSRLVPSLDAGDLDLALISRLPTQSVEILRREAFIWTTSPDHVAWDSELLPVALFEPGSAARLNVLEALGEAGRAYRCAYSSPSLLGLIALVQTGLAVAALAESSIPPTLCRADDSAGLPKLRDLEIGLMRNPTSSLPAVDRLEQVLRRRLAR